MMADRVLGNWDRRNGMAPARTFRAGSNAPDIEAHDNRSLGENTSASKRCGPDCRSRRKSAAHRTDPGQISSPLAP